MHKEIGSVDWILRTGRTLVIGNRDGRHTRRPKRRARRTSQSDKEIFIAFGKAVIGQRHRDRFERFAGRKLQSSDRRRVITAPRGVATSRSAGGLSAIVA